ncbi:TonB-dependent receptor plug domain-containing protein [Sulfurospirillum multivorans]|uniref:Outer membrane protein n=2 Tax=Sulfurospirillum multivorans TaxID=66821 RepID=A0AA86ALS1_SULMK|nr:TonB-dependent receptor plug domain-containing protein [Sulfurospirillum multivorans]AHJ11848.1 outer membrane protein [Sulfurospirillum multivorans DSM 12446]QEH05354.1 outer membrane protein [Sulfurospirillum multivorans]
MKIIVLLGLLSSLLFSDSLDALLQEYKSTSDNSLQTVNEKIGHVVIYSQKEIRLMQYTKLNDILKELPLFNINTNQFGLTNYSLTGSKTTTSGFFRFFINDHEISSGYDQSTSLSWSDLPLDFVDHVEIYYGESSFSFGNETGIYFVRIYTKSALKENSSEINSWITSKGSNSQSFTNSASFENGWSYLMFLNHEKIKYTSIYNGQKLNTNGTKQYLYADISNETTKINMGYTDVSKNNYAGLAFDATPNSGKSLSKDFFVDVTHSFLEDKSLKANLSVDVNDRSYEEENTQGIAIVPLITFSQYGPSGPKRYSEDLRFIKTNAYLSKSFDVEDNSFIAAVNVKNKTYDVQNRESNTNSSIGHFSDFDEETISSLLFQDSYQLRDDLILVANTKLDYYDRNAYLKDSSETLLRVGAIYTPTDNWGFKSFYTQTALAPSFYNVDYADTSKPALTSQQYYIYSLEGVYTQGNSKFGVTFDHVEIDDFLYLSPIGFINIDHRIKTNGLLFDYEYSFSQRDKIHLNYYTSTLSETINNSTKGGYVKFMGGYQKFDYFTSIIYRNGYEYLGLDIPDSFDMSFGVTYHVTKDLSYSLKANNILDRSTQSLYFTNLGSGFFALDDNDRSVTFSIRWVF